MLFLMRLTEKLVIVTGAYFNGVLLDSTEMLINSQWNHYYSMDKGVWHENWPIWLKFALEDANTCRPRIKSQ